MPRRTSIAAALFILLALSLRAADEKKDTDALVTKIAATYGGEAALGKVGARRERGKVVSATRGSGTMLRVLERPQRLRVEVEFPGEPPELRIFDGTKATRDGAPVEGPPRDAMVLQVARMELPLSLLRNRSKLEDLGTVERDGRKLRVLRLPLDGGMAIEVDADPATGQILRTVGTSKSGPMPIEFATNYSDFRTVDGVLFAFGEETFAMGRKTGDTKMESIEILGGVVEKTFRP